MSKILVTGGAGFVGSYLCERLSHDHEVISLDNYFTGSIKNHVNNVDYIRGYTENIFRFFKNEKFDLIYHLGEYSRVEQSFDDILLVHDYNIKGTFQVLEYARHTNTKLIYAGSSTKFADNTADYIMSPYAWSKAINTDLVKKYSEWYGLEYAITYFYNVYGDREISTGSYATLIAKFREKMANNESLTVVKPGTQKRNFTHVDDIVDALILIGNNGVGDEYGIGNPQAYSVLEVANMFGGPIEYLEQRRGNRMSAPVISDKTVALGWQPKRNLPEYIEKLKENNWRV